MKSLDLLTRKHRAALAARRARRHRGQGCTEVRIGLQRVAQRALLLRRERVHGGQFVWHTSMQVSRRAGPRAG